MSQSDTPESAGEMPEAGGSTSYDIPMAEHLRAAIAQDWDPAPPMPHRAEACPALRRTGTRRTRAPFRCSRR